MSDVRSPEADSLRKKIEDLHGPILVLGASGFVGANLMRMLLSVRDDVWGTMMSSPAWRLEGLPEEKVITTDLLAESTLEALLDSVEPLTVFDCISYGAYSFEREAELIYRTNVNLMVRLLEALSTRRIRAYVHAGSSSEYGPMSAAPTEDAAPVANSHYSASKIAAAAALQYMGRERGLPCANLRLYSVYGPYEDSSRLIPTVIARGLAGELPPFVAPDVSRDFVYIDDACEAFVDAARSLREENYGQSLNIGTGTCHTMAQVAEIAREIFRVEAEPEFTMPNRDWDVGDWYANPEKSRSDIGWTAKTAFRDGLARTAEWVRGLPSLEAYLNSTKRHSLNHRHSVSAVIACYRDGQAIPIMYERLTKVFTDLKIEYEIIFVNDCSPDDSEEVIQRISRSDRRVLGISHSRNFGSQAAFRSGMELSTKNACVLLDGDLQDPPELIRDFVEHWQAGHDVVYGRRVKRDAPWYMQLAYKAFYRIFDTSSYLQIPRDAGDFSLMDKRVVRCLLEFPERDLFLRGVRAYAGFKQIGVDYVRPERMFGTTTNSFFKNIGWAKKGILSFSHMPLNLLSSVSLSLVAVALLLSVVQVGARFLFPDLAPRGVTTLMLLLIFFGSANMLAVSLVGEYVAKIFEEVKRRPHFLRRSIIRDGEIRDAGEEAHQILRRRGGR